MPTNINRKWSVSAKIYNSFAYRGLKKHFNVCFSVKYDFILILTWLVGFMVFLRQNKTGILQSSDCISTTVWLHLLDFNKTPGEKVRWEQYKNVACCFELILEAVPYKTTVVQSLTSHRTNLLLGSKDEFISNVLLWTPTHGHTSVGQLAKTCQKQWQ